MQSFDQELELLVIAAIREDVGEGDHSTLSTIPEGSKGKAVLKIKDKGVLAGVAVAEKIFHILELLHTTIIWYLLPAQLHSYLRYPASKKREYLYTEQLKILN